MKIKILALSFVLLASNAFAVNAFKYQQEIDIKKQGVYKIELSPEAISKAWPNAADFKIKNPLDQLIPVYVSSNPLAQRVTYTSFNSINDTSTLVNISLSHAAKIKTVTVDFLDNTNALAVLDISPDEAAWTQFGKINGIAGNKQLTFNLNGKETQFLRVNIGSKNVKIAKVNVDIMPQPESSFDTFKADFSQHDTGSFTILDISLPYNNLPVYSIVLYTSVPNAVKNNETLLVLGNNNGMMEEVLNSFTAELNKVSNNNKAAELVLSSNTGNANILHLDIFGLTKAKITKVELKLAKTAVSFDAKYKGAYTLFLGSSASAELMTDAGLKNKKTSVVKGKNIQGNPAFDDPTALLFPTVKNCGFDLKEAEANYPIAIQTIGVQELPVPFDSADINRVRIIKDGKELPFILAGKGYYSSAAALAADGPSIYKFRNDIKAVTPQDITLFTGNTKGFLANIDIKRAGTENPDTSFFVWDFNPAFNSPFIINPVTIKGGFEYILNLAVNESPAPIDITNVFLGYNLNKIRFYADDLQGYKLVYNPNAKDAKYKDGAIVEALKNAKDISAAEVSGELFINAYTPAKQHGGSIFVKWLLAAVLIVIFIYMATKKTAKVKKAAKPRAPRKKKTQNTEK